MNHLNGGAIDRKAMVDKVAMIKEHYNPYDGFFTEWEGDLGEIERTEWKLVGGGIPQKPPEEYGVLLIDFFIIGMGPVGLDLAYHLKINFPKYKLLIVDNRIVEEGVREDFTRNRMIGSKGKTIKQIEQENFKSVFHKDDENIYTIYTRNSLLDLITKFKPTIVFDCTGGRFNEINNVPWTCINFARSQQFFHEDVIKKNIIIKKEPDADQYSLAFYDEDEEVGCESDSDKEEFKYTIEDKYPDNPNLYFDLQSLFSITLINGKNSVQLDKVIISDYVFTRLFEENPELCRLNDLTHDNITNVTLKSYKLIITNKEGDVIEKDFNNLKKNEKFYSDIIVKFDEIFKMNYKDLQIGEDNIDESLKTLRDNLKYWKDMTCSVWASGERINKRDYVGYYPEHKFYKFNMGDTYASNHSRTGLNLTFHHKNIINMILLMKRHLLKEIYELTDDDQYNSADPDVIQCENFVLDINFA
jgi:hypothetical protein